MMTVHLDELWLQQISSGTCLHTSYKKKHFVFINMHVEKDNSSSFPLLLTGIHAFDY